MNKACRIKSPIRIVPHFSIRGFASFSSNSAANPRILNFSTDEDEAEEGVGGIYAYRYALRHQRPSTIRREPHLQNSVSLIGTVDRPQKLYNTKADTFGVQTLINVINSGDLNRKLRIQLEMWDDVAKLAIKHLKRNDTIYVSGHLGAYRNAGEDRNILDYKVIVRELSYVAQLGQQSTLQKHEESLVEACQKSDESVVQAFRKSEESLVEAYQKSEESQPGGATLGETGIERCTNHLQLWQLFFCKPYEWWDKRKNKRNLSAPDFRHKHSSECLWLRPDDPPWVQKQLQLLDMEIAEQRQMNHVLQIGVDRYKNHHYLWQIFFSNPYEWWDNRKNKKNSGSPDFKHKDTGEALWIKPNDPPWVKRQLQLIDSIMEEESLGRNAGSQSQVSKWLSDD